MAEIRVLESILSPGVQTFHDILLGHKLYKVVQWITLTLCGSSAHDVGGWVGGSWGDMRLRLPQPIRSWLTSKFARVVSKPSGCLEGSPDATFQLCSLETKSETPPAPSGLSQWMWTADHLCSICDTYRAFLFDWIIIKYILKSSLHFNHVVTSVTTHLCRASTFKSCC